MDHDYDYIIIGSGFGGSVSALRLAEKGYRVLVIEKGKWYRDDDFAKSNWNLSRWLWLPLLRWFGIMRITIFRHVNILSGVGVGGGSLVYANTLPVPKSDFFKQGSWATLNNWETVLRPYYNQALQMLGAKKNPKLFDGDLALKNLAQQMGREQQFEPTEVAVFFGEAGNIVTDPYFNGDGPERAGCTFCGGCMTGCRFNAKNTLDKNYLYLAQRLGAKILAESEVLDVKPLGSENGTNGYRISYRSSTHFFQRKNELSACGIIFSGGVLGTVKLLLKLKKQSLPNLSNRVGEDIRTNNETLVSITNLDRSKEMSNGIAIGSILHTDANSHLEICRYNEFSGFWRLSHLPLTTGKNVLLRMGKLVIKFVRKPMRLLRLLLTSEWGKRTVVLLFMQTIDSTLRFKLKGNSSLVSRVATGKKPSPFIPESLELTNRYSEIVNGEPTVFVMETVAGMASTAHILGGAVMGENAENGVIDQYNHVFGYENMLVVDGSMISANPGVNPSLSITAIGEHAMSKIPLKKRIID